MAGQRNEQELNGTGVLVTRPVQQADSLCQEIMAHGGLALRLPVLEITDPTDLQPALTLIAGLAHYDLAIFISTNAVARGIPLAIAKQPWPAHVQIAAIGQRTAQELAQRGLPVTISPQGQYNSEALLQLPALQTMHGKKVAIFRGEGGRELLAETLRQRGATVDYIEVYRRAKPSQTFLRMLHPWTVKDIAIIVVTSNEALQNLYDLCAHDQVTGWLQDMPLVVISERAAALAKELGIKKSPIVSSQPSDYAILDALIAWKKAPHTELNNHDR